MKSKGLFSILLVLLFIQLLPNWHTLNHSLEERQSTQELWMLEMEILNSKRFEIEEGFDRIIENSIVQEAELGNLESANMKKAISKRIIAFLENTEQEINPNLQYYISNGILNESITESGLGEISSVIVQHLRGRMYLVEYSITGSIYRNKTIEAVILGKEFSVLFSVPVGYRKVMVVAGPGNI